MQLADKYGNGVPSTAVSLYISVGTVSGSTVISTNASGQAVFSTLSITKAGTYTFSTGAAGLSRVSSSSFVITPATTTARLSFETQPVSTTVNATMAPVTVLVVDEYGNDISGVSVTLKLSKNTLGGTVTVVTNASGQAIFNKLSVAAEASGYYLTATSPGLTSVNSGTFSIT